MILMCLHWTLILGDLLRAAAVAVASFFHLVCVGLGGKDLVKVTIRNPSSTQSPCFPGHFLGHPVGHLSPLGFDLRCQQQKTPKHLVGTCPVLQDLVGT